MKKLTQKEIGKIVKKAKDREEGKRQVPVRKINTEVSVGVSSQGHMTLGPPGMKLQEDKDGNLRMQIPGFQDVVFADGGKEKIKSVNDKQRKTKASGARSKNGAMEEPADTVRVNNITPSQDDLGEISKRENGAARERPMNDDSVTSKKSCKDVVVFDQDRYKRVLESIKTIFKWPNESNEVEIGKRQLDILKEIKEKSDDNVNDADELSTCSHCGNVDFDMLICSGCRMARFCNVKSCRKNFFIKHRKSDQCKSVIADRFRSLMDKCLKDFK